MIYRSEVLMNGDLFTEIQEKIKQLEISVKSLRNSGREYAQAERDYKILLRQKCLELRTEGMAIGMIQMTAYGVPEVAEARFKRDIAETVYKANQEAINSIKLQLRIIESQLEREWGIANYEDRKN